LTRSIPWELSLEGERFTLIAGSSSGTGSVLLLEKLRVQPGIFWSAVYIEGVNRKVVKLDGVPNAEAADLRESTKAAVAELRQQLHIAKLRKQIELSVEQVGKWVSETTQSCASQLQRRGWLTGEFIEQVAATKPTSLKQLLSDPEGERLLRAKPPAARDSVALWRRPFTDVADEFNKRHVAKELIDCKRFFDSVEKSPLTQEQAEAVLCFDNRVLLVASAGSGKTSTMVAKAGYALAKGYFKPEQVLLLAFNTDAAAELRDRVKIRLEPLGLAAERVVAKTFHAFGLEIIGSGTGKRPSLAPWVESGRDLEALLEMADEIKHVDPGFRAQWDLFRIVFGQDLPKFGKETANPESWDKQSNREGFWTLNGDVVRSRGELLIANWLFYNGVRYVYEASYKFDTADARHRQYKPDFYLCDVDVYLEHWALDENGEQPAEFIGYKEGMDWKRRLHAEHGTRLLETTMADLWAGTAFSYLERQLGKFGVRLDPNPDRPVRGRQPIENKRFARTIRSFLTHAKSNRLGVAELRSRAEKGAAGQFRFRHVMFLGLVERLWSRWEERLRAESVIDYEDMINLAADCIEQGRWASPYELVMVDEFQDASQARARLVAELVKQPDRHLFVVGDDWQSVNRFAGADLSVMTAFEARFGRTSTLKLETTFRCPQSLCDISSRFVQKNPRQLRKAVRSAQADFAEPLRIISVLEESDTRSAVEAVLSRISDDHNDGCRKAVVFLLGRYREDERYMPEMHDAARFDVQFITVHASKGLEADHIIVPKLTNEMLGFPSKMVDDPVLTLAIPEGDGFDFSEERRLLYVALTRARKSVTLVTVTGKESAFITELVRDHEIQVQNIDGEDSGSVVCSKCEMGFLVRRIGRFGPFMGCTNYPRCKHTEAVTTTAPVARLAVTRHRMT